MADIQKTADRIFNLVDRGILESGYATVMGIFIDLYDEDTNFKHLVDTASASEIESHIVSCVQQSFLKHNRVMEAMASSEKPCFME